MAASLMPKDGDGTPRSSVQYLALQRELVRELTRDSLVRGLMSPLIFLWSVGAGLFTIVWWAPPFAISWTAVIIALGVGMVITHLRNGEAVRRSLHAIVSRRLRVEKLSDAGLRAQLGRNIDLVVDIAVLVGVLEGVYGEDSGLRRTLASSHGLLVLHSGAAWAADQSGSPECQLGEEVALELESVTRRMNAAVDGGRLDAWSTVSLANQQEEVLAGIRSGAYAHASGLDIALATADPLAVGGLAQYSESEYLPADVQRLANVLYTGLTRIGSDTGLRALEHLAYEYLRLLPVLDRKRATDPLAIALLPTLALETYRQGLSVLNDAFELAAAVHSPERARLEREAIDLERELSAPEGAALNPTRRAMKNEALTSHRERLDTILQYEFRIEELLHHCGRCEASLDRARMDLAAIKAEASETSVSSVTEHLRDTIAQARSVQSELKRLGL